MEMDNNEHRSFPSDPSDEKLLLAVADGETAALGQLYSRFSRTVFNLALKLLRNHEQAEDVTQDVFIRIHHSADRFLYKSRVSSWIYRITVNRCLNVLRQNKIFQKKHDGFLENTSAPEEEKDVGSGKGRKTSVEIHEMERALFLAVHSLPPLQKIVFVLSRNEHLSNKEIAAILHTSVSSVEARLHRARKKLQKHLVSFR